MALKKRISSKIGIVLFCVIKARSVEPLNVFDLCSIIIVSKQKRVNSTAHFQAESSWLQQRNVSSRLHLSKPPDISVPTITLGNRHSSLVRAPDS